MKCSSAFNPSKSTHTWSSGHTHTTHTHTHTTNTPEHGGTQHKHITHTHKWSSGHTQSWISGHTHTTHTQHTHLEQVDTHTTHTHTTHLEQWTQHTHTHLEQRTHTHTPGAVTLRCPGGSWGSVPCSRSHLSRGNSCRSREPTTSDYKSNARSIRPRLPLDITYSYYCVTSHTVWLSEK